jgi:hypothetical protein
MDKFVANAIDESCNTTTNNQNHFRLALVRDCGTHTVALRRKAEAPTQAFEPK